MNPELWKRVGEILPEARKRHGEERAALLDRLCGGDAELRREVETLLAAEAEAGDLLEPVSVPLPEREDLRGALIGPYRIEKELGQGGMGTVYLAARADDEFEQRVALKILDGRLYDPEAKRRFRRERQILAGLEHPNIAILKDGGTTEAGLLYFVMEYVEGETIDHFCEGLGIRERVRLLTRVCRAVHFFHQNLVLHRDLKPSNILVKADGEPKLLDFGIARLLGGEGGAPPPLEPTGPTPLTLVYASPEQLRGEAVSTASDVYSLGILLYELLTGRSPYPQTRSREKRLAHLTASPPVPPSRVAQGRGEPPGQGAGKTAAGKVPRDLDAIVQKALAQNPLARYASAEQLADDLERHLDGLPVLAREPTAGYRLGKFVRRHHWPLAALAVVFLLLAGFGLRMRFLEARTERILVSVVDLFEDASPLHSGSRNGVEKIEAELQGRPEIQAAVLGAVGRFYMGWGRLEEALPLLERSLEVRRESGAEPAKVALSLQNIAHVLDRMGNVQKALERSREAVEVLEDSDIAVRMARMMSRHARSLRNQGDLEAAEKWHRSALQDRLGHFGPEHEEVAESLNDLALLLRDRGKLEEAGEHCHEALAQRRRIHGPESNQVAITSNNCGLVLLDRGDLPAAEVRFRESLDLRKKIYGPDHPSFARALHNLGIAQQLQGNLQEAGASYERALAILRLNGLAQHPETGYILRNQAALQLEQGDILAETSAYFALRILRETFQVGEHWRVADAESVLGAILLEQDRVAEAEPLLRRGYQTLSEIKGEDSRQTREALERLRLFEQRSRPLHAREPP